MSGQTPCLRIADELRRRIAEHVWEAGDRLPSRAQIGQECGVGENVVRRAQELLISQGVLEGRAGSGTYVAEARRRVRVVRSSAREQGESDRREGPGTSGDRRARLGAAEGELCVRTEYEILADGRPAQLSTSWEPYDLTTGTLVVLSEGGPHDRAGVVKRMAVIAVTVSHAVEQPKPRQATTEEASLLGIQKAALVTHIRRTYYIDQGRPVETAHRGARGALRNPYPSIARAVTGPASTGRDAHEATLLFDSDVRAEITHEFAI